ncbi:MAG: LacI family DNA-binding transcriptional regulator [Rhodospirillaceae bacterium]|nr:LacI family DNA-binding transcriptional regulator [Rhodospirillaceae bacterium]
MSGVSKKTVSRIINDSPVVNEETRAKVKRIIAETGYVPDPQARGLAFRKSFLIAMIYDNPSPEYIVSMQKGILSAIEGTSFQLVVRPCDRTKPTFLSDMRSFVERQRLFGVLLPPSVSEDEGLVKVLRELNCDYVRIASVSLDKPEVMLVTNDHIGGYEAGQHLAEQGHKIIAHVSGLKSFRSVHERRRGFARALAENGIDLPEKLVLEGAYTFESGLACGEKLLAMKPRPTAVFAGNDEMAAGIYRAARNHGLEIPRDLSVVGYDDNPTSLRLWPPLTTIRIPTENNARMAATMLIKKAPVPHDDTLPSLVVRESTAKPAKS